MVCFLSSFLFSFEDFFDCAVGTSTHTTVSGALIPRGFKVDKIRARLPPFIDLRLFEGLMMLSVPYTRGIAGHSGTSSVFIGSGDRIRGSDPSNEASRSGLLLVCC